METDMKILTSNSPWSTATESATIVEYVERGLDGSDYNLGQLEEAVQGLRNAHLALGRLLEVLAEKGILTAPDITEIVRYRDDSATFES